MISLYSITICAASFILLPCTLTNSNYSTNKKNSQYGYVPYYGSTQDSVYSDNDDSYNTAYDGNNHIYNNEYENNENDYDLMFPEKDSSTKSPPAKGNTFMPIIPGGDEDEGDNEVRYNEKWNTVEDNPGQANDENSHAPGPSGGGAAPDNEMGSQKPVRTPSGTMVLVIGIILGAFVAMLLIVIIVLKYRTGVDRSAMIKCEDSAGNAPHSHGPPNQGPGNSNAPRYQFAHPNDYGELGVAGGGPGHCENERETATTALMEGGGPRGPGRGGPSGNGFFNNNCNNLAAAAHVAAHNGGDRSRLFRKSNGSKPVREWYV